MQDMLFTEPRPVGKWKPPQQLPELSRYDSLGYDLEATGKNKHKDLPVGVAICIPDAKRYYIPFGHRGGGNLDPALVKRWMTRELRGKHLYGLNTGFDCEIARNWGVDLEQQGCVPHDVAHRGALLNEHRYAGLDLDSLGKEYVGKGKVKLPFPPEQIADAHSSEVGPYAEEDASLAYEIKLKTDPLIAAENLEKVLALEDGLIYCVNEMERNGARLDVKKLAKWRAESTERLNQLGAQLYKATGFRCNPDSVTDMRRLYGHLGLQVPIGYDEEEKREKETFSLPFILNQFKVQKVADIPNLPLRYALQLKQIKSLKSKYIDKYWRERDGEHLWFQLHQLKTDKEAHGTITGRFSSSNINIQQVMKVEKQIKKLGDEFVIRELFIPDDGFINFATDAAQIEFRLFAHYSNSPKLIKAYEDDPDVDFHNIVTEMIRIVYEAIDRGKAKGINFGKIYGMGLGKLCAQLGLSQEDGKYLIDMYDEAFPEAKRLMNQASRLAKQRGYVKDYLGRRRRYPDGKNLHSALNAVIQGTAASYNKLKLLRVYNERHTIGIHKMRATVHDELYGDMPKDNVVRRRLEECMAVQEMDLKVPILWDSEYGPNWRECA